MSEAQLVRIMTRQRLTRADLLAVVLFAHGHPALSISQALFDFVRGVGPAALARGRKPKWSYLAAPAAPAA